MATAVWLIGLNLVDAVATWQGLAAGVMTEANPLLAGLLRSWPAGAWLFKLGVVPLLILAVGAAPVAWAKRALRLLVLAYGAVAALHLTGLLLGRA